MEKDILSGRLSVGQKLPSERELAERFAVSKAVIHAGILEMEANGFVLVRPRVGTFVSDLYSYARASERLCRTFAWTGGRKHYSL